MKGTDSAGLLGPIWAYVSLNMFSLGYLGQSELKYAATPPQIGRKTAFYSCFIVFYASEKCQSSGAGFLVHFGSTFDYFGSGVTV